MTHTFTFAPPPQRRARDSSANVELVESTEPINRGRALTSNETSVLFSLGLALIIVGTLGVGITVGGVDIKPLERLTARKSALAVGLGVVALTASWANSTVIPVVGAVVAGVIATLAWLSWLHWVWPSENDSELTTLRKLGIRFLETKRPNASLDIEGTRWNLWELQRFREKRPIWVAPTIIVEWNDDASEDLRNQVEDNLQRSNDPRGLARLLESGLKSDALAVAWEPGPQGRGRPYRAAVEEMRSRGNIGSIVQQS